MTTSLTIFSKSHDEARITQARRGDTACTVYGAPEGALVLQVWADDRATSIDVGSLLLSVAQTHPQLLRDALAASA